MQIESIAVLFVFIGNGAAIILLAFMLFRILGQTEETHRVMRQGSNELLDSAKRVKDMLQAVDRLCDRLIDANKLAIQNGQMLNISSEHLEKIAALTDSLSSDRVEAYESILGDMRQLLESLYSVKPEGYPQWRQEHQGKLDQAMNQRSHLNTELEQVKIRLDEANVVISELRRANRLAEASTQSADVLRQNMEQQQQLLNRAKERAQKAEATVNTLTQEMEKVQAEAAHLRQSAVRDLDDVREQMNVVEQERAKLFQQLEELKGTMHRTLLEKNFIEDKLLDLDEAARLAKPKQGEAAALPDSGEIDIATSAG